MVTSLITGGAGFIGSHVAKHCLNLGHRVIILDDLSGGFEENLPKGVIFIKQSINNDLFLKDLFVRYKFDFVYHLAAYAAEGLSHFIRNFNYKNNLIGSINLINNAVLQGVKCFLFTSSIAVYGAGQTPMSEELIPSPEDPYGIAKYAVEMDLKSAHKMFGLNYIIFRPHNVYGEHQNIGDKYRNVIGIFMNQIMNNENITIFGDGEQTRAFTYIDDVAPIIANAVNNQSAYNETFNIGADEPFTVNALADIIALEFGVALSKKYLAERNEVKHAFSDHEKLNRYFKSGDHKTIDEGIKRMASWVKASGAKSSVPFDNIEIYKNLPTAWR